MNSNFVRVSRVEPPKTEAEQKDFELLCEEYDKYNKELRRRIENGEAIDWEDEQ